MGCLSQRYRDELPIEILEVDKWFGKFDYLGIIDEVRGERLELKGKGYERTLTTPNHYAYLKIAEGCNRYCSYCAIPLITGRFTSRRVEDILDEVRWLVEQGVKEFNVIAQDLSSYGLDLYGEHRLAQLVDEMAQIDGVEWIRLHYTYPTDFPYDLLPVMAKHTNVCKYMDIALQHCSDNMLKKMHRHITREEQDAVIARIRREVPGICIRTTLLVGHPGESEEDFAELCEWVKEMKFERMGAFAYSEEEGTYAAQHYSDDIPEEEKDRRVDTLMAIQQEISAQILRKMIGQTLRVLVDREEEEYYVGRTEYDSPEVDCEVLIEKTAKLKLGEFYTVTIQKTEDFDLYASL
jgi:ribosomal protein S12 methylthiotransferase